MNVPRENTEGLMLMQKLLEQKHQFLQRSRRGWFWSMTLIVLLCLAALLATSKVLFAFVGLLSLFGLVLVMFSRPGYPRLSMEEYKSIPGALNVRRHVCLHCGHHGIHRRTIYQTSTTLADCSACQAPLWAS